MTSKCRFPRAVLFLGAAVAMMIALGGPPAAASDEPTAVAASRKFEPSTSSSMARVLQAKSKRHMRYVRSQPTRVASPARPCGGLYGWFACDRQIVLMIGVGY